MELFVALLPDSDFAGKLLTLKSTVGKLAGPQLYLDDPPHLTLLISSFASEAAVEAALNERSGSLDAPRIAVQGWHVFEGDALTGCHSLVCELRSEDEMHLRRIQQSVLDLLAPLRDPFASYQRFQPFQERLSPDERENIERWGFPYVGPIWRPHFTVASIQPEDWDTVWNELRDSAPAGDLVCPELALYRLDAKHPTQVGRFTLR